jgi:glycosyltransferase involved in cell wall biosynthesis
MDHSSTEAGQGQKTKRDMLSVVVPVMNEEMNVRPFHEAARRVLNEIGLSYEIIFVDDGSTDGTLEGLLALHETDPHVKVISLSRNFGSYNAILAGLSNAVGDAVITISVDLQDPPELFEEFVTKWQEGYQVVWAVREARDDPLGKRLLARLFYQLVRWVALPDFPINGMDCSLFDRRVVKTYLQFVDRDNIPFVSVYWMGFRQCMIPYHRRRRTAGQSKWPLGRRLKSAIDVMAAFSYLPIRFISLLGLIISTLSFLAALIIILNRLFFGVGGLGWPSLMVTILFLGGMQMIMIGILGEYIWRISEHVRNRPRFIIQDKIGIGCELDKRGSE